MKTTITERDAVLRERAAFERGIQTNYRGIDLTTFGNREEQLARAEGAARVAKERYPLPTVTRPRVWTDANGRKFRVVGGQVQTQSSTHESGETWHCLDTRTDAPFSGDGGLALPIRRVLAIADLIANPTEAVEA